MADEQDRSGKSAFTLDDTAGKVAAFSGAAPFANRIYLTLTPVVGRLSFVEFPPPDLSAQPQFRAAITMNIGDLVSLRDLLDQQLKGAKVFQVEGKDAPSQ